MHQHTDLKFFTNEPDRDLYSRFSNILKSNTQFFDILVGYFRTSGFFRMYEAMEDVEKIRVLVGLNVDKYTVKIIDKATSELKYEMPTIKEAKDSFAEGVEDEFNKAETTALVEQGVRVFIDWLKSGKLEMKMYVDAPIHAKVYIMRKDPDKVPDMFGSVITGSSNFSEAGLQNNLEFNVELKDSSDVQFALDKFEELWAKGVPITADYIDAVEQRTWLRNDITPYEIYLKTLYEFFKEEINADKDLLADNLLPEGYMRLQYQIDAVVQAKKILEAYNGVFISDVVGLGKTYICAMLAKSLKKGRKLIICPPVLVDYWKDVLLEFDVAAEVESLGKLDRILDKGDLLDSGTLKILKKQDEFIFTNPGSLKLSVEEIFKGGNSKSRNPAMQLMLRMVGFGDNAGSGIPTILNTWKEADWVEPNLYEDTHLNQVTLTLKTWATWTESVDELQNSIVYLPSISEESMTAMKNALSIYNLGISPEVRANLTQVAIAVSNAMKTVNQLDFSGLYEAVSRFAEVSKMMQPASENARKLAALISDELKISIESANKSANSDEKSANKSADNMTVLTKRQEQILTIMEEGREYTTEAIAGIIGLKGPRTRQLMNELVDLGKVESIGTTKDRRYRKE